MVGRVWVTFYGTVSSSSNPIQLTSTNLLAAFLLQPNWLGLHSTYLAELIGVTFDGFSVEIFCFLTPSAYRDESFVTLSYTTDLAVSLLVSCSIN